MDTFQKLYGPNAAQNPDNVLEQAVGEYESVFIIGWNKDGFRDARASLNMDSTDIIYLMEQFKHDLLAGKFGQ